jgi:hypothetical protein
MSWIEKMLGSKDLKKAGFKVAKFQGFKKTVIVKGHCNFETLKRLKS